jgi:hypothetical protein
MNALELDPAIEANPDLLAAVRRANELLEVELGRSSGLVSASWKLLHDDRDRALLRLTISDWTGSVYAVFTPDDLKDAWKTQGRMIRLWGDLLQIRSHELLDEMQAASSGRKGD